MTNKEKFYESLSNQYSTYGFKNPKRLSNIAISKLVDGQFSVTTYIESACKELGIIPEIERIMDYLLS